jgi:integrase
LHDFRHSHASILLKQGIHPKIVKERLGHSSISTTLDIYSHVAPGLQAAAAAGFDNILKPKESKLDKELCEITK